ncbi:putative mitochondrial Cytochrome c oxidase assembly factor-like protein [Leptomonas pyrrhocoris]|uniref:Putative mitochondrial Cytochrome c oxidase assembly factor-like protein n=1 Tax=Leptomonas pyrrhocoris TaxID=157538 RepID=A0A0M9FST9_LEPPY|nr:putative mitochondrial Cytochrome c oxidase assembly factor-like protein [Leptomonas pyrrhocoris]XP_015653752.1 putative mitochondrial Cytochrome c oxidase assembly factor-like protein [Leptomonas pyrrhocoris]KPA75312.1 putative mitochondrial Cytochrome c oxidase assembly factor-like protein [Leptomonas pyrrhocoris]KPA75313.1 putative mitochondrial Cytochrome c oxidase assembly factor-like protein [Leptomonas pyrrhocoris]|eukprot:XP_015653751.1 putative mitochondrial Cytochrome c oxidase assembly factor-like protein [Leptomonas pyrrhocoris]
MQLLRKLQQRPFLRYASSTQPFYARFKYGPRSRAEFWGLVAGASIFPVFVALTNWYENQKLVKPELAPDFQSTKSVKMEPRTQLGGPFRLRESRTGEYITDEELFKDKWTLLYFGFSKCAEICPNTLTYISQVMKACDEEYGNDPDLANEEKKLQAVFLSIDFLRDQPEVVEKFVRKYDPRVRGLCGTKQEVETAAKAWRVYYSSVDETDEEREAREAKGVDAPVIDDTYQFDHSSAIYLVGPDCKMKDFYFQVMGIRDTVDRIGVHISDVYGFSDTRKE